MDILGIAVFMGLYYWFSRLRFGLDQKINSEQGIRHYSELKMNKFTI